MPVGPAGLALDPRELAARLDAEATNYAAITRRELQAMLADTHGAEILSFTALTEPAYRKTGCPWKDNLFKLARVNGTINWDYARAVNRQREREGVPPDFESLPRAWGTHLRDTPFISHVTKGGDHRLYVKLKVHHSLGHVYLTGDGGTLAEEDVAPFLAPKRGNPRQGLEKEVLERDYTVSNMVALKMRSMGYIIAGE